MERRPRSRSNTDNDNNPGEHRMHEHLIELESAAHLAPASRRRSRRSRPGKHPTSGGLRAHAEPARVAGRRRDFGQSGARGKSTLHGSRRCFQLSSLCTEPFVSSFGGRSKMEPDNNDRPIVCACACLPASRSRW